MVVKNKHYPSEERVAELIGGTLRLPPQQLHAYTRLKDDLHLDAVDLLLLIAKLERKFGVYLSAEEVEAIETVGDASAFFQRHAA